MAAPLNQATSSNNVLNINTLNNLDDDESDLLTPLIRKNIKPYGQHEPSDSSSAHPLSHVSHLPSDQNEWTLFKICLYLTDVLLSVFVFSPVVLIYW